MAQYPAFIRTYTPLVVSALVGWLASVGLNVSDEAQTALAVGIGGVAAAAYYAIIRALEKRWPALGVLLGSAKTPDGYSKGVTDYATQAVPGDDARAVAEDDAAELEDDTDDDTADDAEDSDDDATDDADDEITDDLDDQPDEADATPVAADYTPRHSA
jgi:hypothetical protein